MKKQKLRDERESEAKKLREQQNKSKTEWTKDDQSNTYQSPGQPASRYNQPPETSEADVFQIEPHS